MVDVLILSLRVKQGKGESLRVTYVVIATWVVVSLMSFVFTLVLAGAGHFLARGGGPCFLVGDHELVLANRAIRSSPWGTVRPFLSEDRVIVGKDQQPLAMSGVAGSVLSCKLATLLLVWATFVLVYAPRRS